MNLSTLTGEMEVSGRDDLKQPLLQHVNGVAIDIPQQNNDTGKTCRTFKFKIGEIKFASCALSIESVLVKLNGVESAVVSPIEGQAAVTYLPELVNAKQIKETIEEAGFPVDDFPEQDIAVCRLRIKGMTCTSCSESWEHALNMVDGVKNAVVGVALEEAKVHFDLNLIDTNHIIEVIEDAGFGADLISSGNNVNKVHLKLEGVHLTVDVNFIKSYLESSQGVNHVEMDLAEKRMQFAMTQTSLVQDLLYSTLMELPMAPRLIMQAYMFHRDREKQSSCRKFGHIGISSLLAVCFLFLCFYFPWYFLCFQLMVAS